MVNDSKGDEPKIAVTQHLRRYDETVYRVREGTEHKSMRDDLDELYAQAFPSVETRLAQEQAAKAAAEANIEESRRIAIFNAETAAMATRIEAGALDMTAKAWHSSELQALIAVANQHWQQAKPVDPKTWPTERVLSKALAVYSITGEKAKKAMTIIRPDYARGKKSWSLV